MKQLENCHDDNLTCYIDRFICSDPDDEKYAFNIRYPIRFNPADRIRAPYPARSGRFLILVICPNVYPYFVNSRDHLLELPLESPRLHEARRFGEHFTARAHGISHEIETLNRMRNLAHSKVVSINLLKSGEKFYPHKSYDTVNRGMVNWTMIVGRRYSFSNLGYLGPPKCNISNLGTIGFSEAPLEL